MYLNVLFRKGRFVNNIKDLKPISYGTFKQQSDVKVAEELGFL